VTFLNHHVKNTGLRVITVTTLIYDLITLLVEIGVRLVTKHLHMSEVLLQMKKEQRVGTLQKTVM
jgi:hypothetical protein